MRPDPILPVIPSLASPPARAHAARRPAGGDRDDPEPPADVVGGGEDRMEHLAMVAATVAPPLRMSLVKREPVFPAVGPARRSARFHDRDTQDCCDASGESGFGCEPGLPGRDLV